MKKFTLLFLLITPWIFFGQTHTWTGAGDGFNWFTPSNWDSNSVPTSSSEVLIPDGFTVFIADSPASITSIEIQGESILNLENNIQLSDSINVAISSRLNWTKGILSGGGGINNDGMIVISSFDQKELFNFSINNNGIIDVEVVSIIRMENASEINNSENGVITFLAGGGIIESDAGNSLNNSGRIRSIDEGDPTFFYLILDVNNSGVIATGKDKTFLLLGSIGSFHNMENGVMLGSGIFDITTNFTNDGIVVPGDYNVTNELSITNDFTMSSGSRVLLDLNGTDPQDFDKLDIFGSPELNGTLEINLTFAPEIEDVFTVITWNLSGGNCNLPSITTAQYDGIEYTFEILCNQNDVTLKVVDEVLDVDGIDADMLSFELTPNPVEDILRFSIGANIIELYNKLEIVIVNSLGQELKREFITSTTKEINLTHLSDGLYFAQLHSNKKVISSEKLIKS